MSAAGDISHDEVVALVERAFGTGEANHSTFEPAPALPAGERVMAVRRDTTQAQLCLGVPGLRRDDPEAWTLEVLNAILGDGMSSRLFQSVREEKGLAYDVSSYIVDYADAGAFVVSAGVDPDKIAAGDRGDPGGDGARSATRSCRPTNWRAPSVPGGPAGAADGGDAPRRLVARRAGSAPREGSDLDEALAELNAVTAERLQPSP